MLYGGRVLPTIKIVSEVFNGTYHDGYRNKRDQRLTICGFVIDAGFEVCMIVLFFLKRRRFIAGFIGKFHLEGVKGKYRMPPSGASHFPLWENRTNVSEFVRWSG